jgi:hypothetical protein
MISPPRGCQIRGAGAPKLEPDRDENRDEDRDEDRRAVATMKPATRWAS